MMPDVDAASAAGTAELRRGEGAVCTTLAPGAPITVFQHHDADHCSAGAWCERGPTIAACTMPTYVSAIAGMSLPAGGVLATVEPVVQVLADDAGQRVHATWPPTPYPLTFRRTVTLEADGALRSHYDVTNDRLTALPFVWGLEVPLAWDDRVRLTFPAGSRARVVHTWGDGLPGAGSEFAWPALRDGGQLLDLSMPARLTKGRGVLCYVELPRGRFTVRSPQGAMEVVGTPGVVTHARVLIEHEAPLPGRAPARWWRRQAPRRSITVMPTVGAPDALSDAVGNWNAARWIDAHASVHWDVTFRGTPLSPPV